MLKKKKSSLILYITDNFSIVFFFQNGKTLFFDLQQNYKALLILHLLIKIKQMKQQMV